MPTYFDDLERGYRSEVGTYRLTADDIVAFASRWDPQPFHTDRDAAVRSIYGGLTASSLHLFAICTRLFFDHQDRIAVLAMLGKARVRFPNPARADDTLRYVTQCVGRRASRSKPDRGVIQLEDRLTNQRDELVMSQRVTLLVARRPAA